MAQDSSRAASQEQAGRRIGQQARPHRLERPAPRQSLRYPPRDSGDLGRRLTKFAIEECMERIDRRTLNLVPLMAARRSVR